MKRIIFLLVIAILFSGACKNETPQTTDDANMQVNSPDGKLSVSLSLDTSGRLFYHARYNDSSVLKNSRMGIIREDADFSNQLSFNSSSGIEIIEDNYQLKHGKKDHSVYKAKRRTFKFSTEADKEIQIVFQVSNDGFGFRYVFPEEDPATKKISKELTSFNFPEGTTGWLQPRATAKSGWNKVNPSYEEHYLTDIRLEQLAPNDSGWIFPILAKTSSCWVSLTESWPEDPYCGSHLNKGDAENEFIIDFPEPTEGFPDREVYPESSLPWKTPWRIVTIGSLETLAASTLGTDLAPPSVLENTDYVQAGRASWSWVLMKDSSVNYKTQQKFIHYAAEMGWEYCLIDADWDTRIGWDDLQKLAELAQEKNIKLILWYNSAGSWNTTPYHPRDVLTHPQRRKEEFEKIRRLGIAGIKVDFFGGDGQSMMRYYEDILLDAHAYQLMVNCHGATLPRGLHRTYPNLVSMESVRGLEYATFGQETADRVSIKSTILPFTRNIFDPMDFTPTCFTEYDNYTRITGNACELAQAILFLSGVQHYAVTPWGMATVPDYVKNMMKEIPSKWDETIFIDGYPGSYVILARRTGDTWYVAGINAEDSTKEINISLPFNSSEPALLITEGKTLRSFQKQLVDLSTKQELNLQIKSMGGVVIQCKITD